MALDLTLTEYIKTLRIHLKGSLAEKTQADNLTQLDNLTQNVSHSPTLNHSEIDILTKLTSTQFIKPNKTKDKEKILQNFEQLKLKINIIQMINSALQGDTNCERAYGLWLLEGKYVEKDQIKGIAFLTKAAEKGDAEDQFALYLCTYNNNQHKNSTANKEAIIWLDKAANQNHQQACFMRGCFLEEQGNIKGAIENYVKATSISKAMLRAYELLEIDDKEKASECLKLAAELDEPYAILLYAYENFKNGRNVEAYLLFSHFIKIVSSSIIKDELAADRNSDHCHPLACWRLGEIYSNGLLNAKENKILAKLYYKKAIEIFQKHTDKSAIANNYLGKAFEHGFGCDIDLELSKKYYQQENVIKLNINNELENINKLIASQKNHLELNKIDEEISQEETSIQLTPEKKQQEEINELIKIAYVHFQKNSFSEAIKTYDHILDKYGKSDLLLEIKCLTGKSECYYFSKENLINPEKTYTDCLNKIEIALSNEQYKSQRELVFWQNYITKLLTYIDCQNEYKTINLATQDNSTSKKQQLYNEMTTYSISKKVANKKKQKKHKSENKKYSINENLNNNTKNKISNIIPFEIQLNQCQDYALHALRDNADANSKNYIAYATGEFVLDQLLKRDNLLTLSSQNILISTDCPTTQIKNIFSDFDIYQTQSAIIKINLKYDEVEIQLSEKPTASIPTSNHFTITSLFYDDHKKCLIDQINAYEDYKNKKIRVSQDKAGENFSKDSLQLLEALHLKAKTGFKFSDDVERAIIENISLLSPQQENQEIKTIINNNSLLIELMRIFSSGYALKNFKLLSEYRIFEIFFPEAAKSISNNSIYPQFIADMLIHLDEMVKGKNPVSPSFVLATLLWPALHTILSKTNETTPLELDKTIARIFEAQLKIIAIPPAICEKIKNIWKYTAKELQLCPDAEVYENALGKTFFEYLTSSMAVATAEVTPTAWNKASAKTTIPLSDFFGNTINKVTEVSALTEKYFPQLPAHTP